MRFTTEGNNAWLFQKAYYKGFTWEQKDSESYAPAYFKTRLNQLKSTTLVPAVELPGNTAFELFTVYPGLATGVGVKHESKSKGELKLGFEFDYTSGMPVIRGHSLKGALRAAFPQQQRKNSKYKEEKAYRLHCWMEDKPVDPEGLAAFKADRALYDRITIIEEEIFEGKRDGKLLPSYKQDVFFDAYISEASKYESTKDEYLGADSITPHIKRGPGMTYEKSMLTNPVPIPFLKVLPGVAFEFRFTLHDNGLLTRKQKEDLFKKILLENGIGAKTNVGYGQFTEKQPGAAKTQTAPANEEKPDEVIPREVMPLLKKNKTFDGEIIIAGDKFLTIQFTIGSNIVQIGKVKKDKLAAAVQDQKVTVTIQTDYKVTEPLNCSVKLK